MHFASVLALLLSLAGFLFADSAQAEFYFDVSHLDWRVPYPSPDSLYLPFKSLTEAYSYVPAGSNETFLFRIYSGSYPETLTISRKVTLSAVDGTVKIGGIFGDNPHKDSESYLHRYKGQTHAHANVSECPNIWGVCYDEWGSDPDRNPTEVEEAYRSVGYNFIAMTHHFTIIPDPGVGILHINGEENGDWDWPYNPPHIISIGNSLVADDDDWTCQQRLDFYTGQGGLAIIAHPVDACFDQDAYNSMCVGAGGHILKDLRRYIGAEIGNPPRAGSCSLSYGFPCFTDEDCPANYCIHLPEVDICSESQGSCMYSPCPVNTCVNIPKTDIELWDEALTAGYLRWGIASDDSHGTSSFDQGWITVSSNRTPIDRNDIIENIRWGNFYSHRRGNNKGVTYADAPQINVSIYEEERKIIVNGISVTDSNYCDVRFIGSNGQELSLQRVFPPRGTAVYQYTGTEGGYVRVEAVDDDEWKTFSQPIKVRQ